MYTHIIAIYGYAAKQLWACILIMLLYLIITTDGHHKLIRWKIVTHAAIDGYSRMIVFMKCSNNNKATTVDSHFLEAIHNYGLPSRVRSDQGRENCLVARRMLEH